MCVYGEREAERKSRVANRRRRSEGQAITHKRRGERIKRTGHHKDEENAKKMIIIEKYFFSFVVSVL